MINAVYGFIGAVIAILVFVGGVGFGYQMARNSERKPDSVKAAEEEQRRITEENKAFADLMGYDINRAYGIGSDDS